MSAPGRVENEALLVVTSAELKALLDHLCSALAEKLLAYRAGTLDARPVSAALAAALVESYKLGVQHGIASAETRTAVAFDDYLAKLRALRGGT